ncbi:aminoacyl-histidine dipeptidase [Sedimenticola sp.]|uniref:aminoacyl-histidine dipeptidase n=1 Tax=Sedimenticola sp. TaxID=1940285 RepID=UPI0025886B82|nr:aminoacyl-histidine dipeptidase [Sedimenticola sp.]MCW8902500.1 aminoacyl-histidine dipeptidase [Sedimenticola sp.]
MNDAISNLFPQPVWKHFDQLTRIPRPSHHEAAVQAYVMQVGEQLGLQVIRDQVDNILIRKTASPGMESAPGVVLQGHLDMVPQANADTQHDFTMDPIRTRIEQDWVKASGTTLGADNGIGVAAALAVLESRQLKHGPIEALFTSNEEDGMTGAFGIRPDWLQGKLLLNMDSEDEGVLCIGCAGGANASTRLEYTPEAIEPGWIGYRLTLKGLKGGHSGVDIHRSRGNANKLLSRLLSVAESVCDIRLSSFAGGNMRNAIPREATGVFQVSASRTAELKALIEVHSDTIKLELAAVEPDLSIELQPDTGAEYWLPQGIQQGLLDALMACPNGVMRMSDTMPGLVESSTNLAIVKAADGRIEIKSLIRSSVDSARDELCAVHQSLFRLIGAKTVIDGQYPGWKPDLNSPLLRIMRHAYQEIFDNEAEIGAIHAGLECGIIGGKYPGLDMISFGPTIRYPHSPDECMHIPSVQRFWDLLVATLARLQ